MIEDFGLKKNSFHSFRSCFMSAFYSGTPPGFPACRGRRKRSCRQGFPAWFFGKTQYTDFVPRPIQLPRFLIQLPRFLSLRRSAGFSWAAAGIGAATGVFWLLRHALDKGQASLLYLPVVIACAIRFGFGPAVFGAVLSFFCWNFFFLPPFGTLIITDPRDWLSLGVFLVAAVSTAQLAARARTQTEEAQAREAEIALLFEASETLSREVRADRLLAALSAQMLSLCQVERCLVFRQDTHSDHLLPPAQSPPFPDTILQVAQSAADQDQALGFGERRFLWDQAVRQSRRTLPSEAADTLGVYLPLHADGSRVGVLYVGPRRDGRPFSAADERLIRTLANHAAVVIARDALAASAAQADALREADRMKDALLSLVSHELRTPLAAIKASATGLLQPDAVWDVRASWETLSAINTEADRLTALVSNLLDLSRLEAGRWQPQKDWCDLLEVVGTALDRLPDAEAARVEVVADSNLPFVQADYTQMALVVTNLLQNAVKYTPPASPIVLCIAAAPSKITLTVRDHGSGLLPGEETRLFERFYRGQTHQNSTIHGTGLGLALCWAIAEAHGGQMQAANVPPGQPPGAVFTLTLPVSRKAPKEGKRMEGNELR